MADHKLITDPEIHEPKGISAAVAKSVYIANGAGSGSWQTLANYFSTEGVNGSVIVNGTITVDKLSTNSKLTSNNLGQGCVGYFQLGQGAVHGENLGSYNAATADGKTIWKLVLRQLMSDSFQTGDVCPLFGSVDAQLFVNGTDYSKVSGVGLGTIIDLSTLTAGGGSALYRETRAPLPDQTMVMSTYLSGDPTTTPTTLDKALPLGPPLGTPRAFMAGHPMSSNGAGDYSYVKTYNSMFAAGHLTNMPLGITFSTISAPLSGVFIVDQVFLVTDAAPANLLRLHARFRRIG